MSVDGALAAAVVDYSSGMLLGAAGGGIDLELAAGGNTEVMRSKLKTMQMLGLDDSIDDILITLGKQYHLIRPLAKAQDVLDVDPQLSAAVLLLRLQLAGAKI